MKRILTMAGVILASCAAMAGTQIVDGIEWSYTVSGGKASISGANPATGNITIPATLGDYSVTSIGYRAFKGRSELTGVTIPAGVTSINDYAFEDCSGLMSFDVNEGNQKYKSENGLLLMKDGTTLIAGVNGNVTIPEGVTSIGYFAFKGCSGLTSVTMPTSVTAIGIDAFYNCSGLTCVTIPEGVMSIGDDAFYNCSGLTSVEISSSVTIIGNSAFEGCSKLTSVTIPSSVTRIDSGAFSYCYSLTNVAFSGNAPNCGALTFFLMKSGCTATVYEGTMGWDDDGDGKWQGLTLLWRKASKPDGGPYTETVDDVEWTYTVCNGKASVGGGSPSSTAVPTSKTTGAIEIPSKLGGCPVTSVDEWAFYQCSGMTSIAVPLSVTSIGNDAFTGCSGLKSVTIPSCVTSIGDAAFYDCRELTNVTIPSSVTSIGDAAFRGCRGLANVTIPEGVKSIGDWAFCDCGGLMNVAIPSSVTSIGDAAFSSCSGMLSFVVDAVNPNYKSINGLLLSKDGKALIFGINGKVTIPSSVTSIGDQSFSERSGLTSVTIPESVTNIAGGAFCRCSGLKSVTIPKGVLHIGYAAFYFCSGLTNMTITSSVMSIGGHAFYYCSKLTNVVFGGNAPTCGSYAFDGVKSGCTATVYEGTTGWGDSDTWNELKLIYRRPPFPPIDDGATAEEILAALEGSVDEKLTECITNVANYNAYREWAENVKGINGTETAGAQAVKDSPNAWVSFALGSKKLLEQPPTDEDLSVEAFKPSSKSSKFDFTVSVKDIEVGSDAAADNLKKVFGLEGGTTLEPGGLSSDNVNITFGTPENGKVKFTAGPKNTREGTFFMKVKMTP